MDLLVPLETNLEKDTKVVQHEQKKFLQQHKVRMESYQKAVSTMKKQRKKKATPENTEKELRVSLQTPYLHYPNDLTLCFHRACNCWRIRRRSWMCSAIRATRT